MKKTSIELLLYSPLKDFSNSLALNLFLLEIDLSIIMVECLFNFGAAQTSGALSTIDMDV